MEKKFIGKISDTTKTRLKERLNNSSYWAEKFDSLNLLLSILILNLIDLYLKILIDPRDE